MAVRVVALVARDSRARFAAAAGYEPLSALSAPAAAELAALLDQTVEFDDLPGRWQAALLQAEAAGAGRTPPSSPCCGGAVEVREEDPSGLAGVQEPDAGEPVRGEPAREDGFDAAERGRTVQPGL